MLLEGPAVVSAVDFTDTDPDITTSSESVEVLLMKYLSARMASHGALLALNADKAEKEGKQMPLALTFRSAYPFRDTKVTTPNVGTSPWTADRDKAVRDAFMSTMADVAAERMERASKDPKHQ